jgi:hypothetical protein
MLSFKEYISEGTGKISSSGSQAARHTEKYIKPFIKGNSQHAEGTHTLAVNVAGMSAGENVTLHSHHVDDKGVHHVVVSRANTNEKISIPTSKLHKVGTKQENEGHVYERNFLDRMKNHGIAPKEAVAAGSTASNDFPIINNKKKVNHGGRVTGDLLQGEAKSGVTAAMGQLTIKHDPAKGGWHIPDEARAKRPEYAKHIENAGILDHMNKHHDPDKHEIETTSSGRAKSIPLHHPNMDPADAYLRDHHVHVLQVGGGFGTYRVGDKDVTGHGLPKLEGAGKWTIREKQAGNKRARTVMFQPAGIKSLKKSHVNLDDDNHVESFKKTLGHK